MGLIRTINIKDELGNKAYLYKGYAIYKNEGVSPGYWGSWSYSKATQVSKGVYAWGIIGSKTSSAQKAKDLIDRRVGEQSIERQAQTHEALQNAV